MSDDFGTQIRDAAKLLESNDPNEIEAALLFFEHLLTIGDRRNDGMIFAMAVAFMRQGRQALAEVLFTYVLTINPKFIEASNNLGFICSAEGRRDEALSHFKRCLDQDPERPEFLNNMATHFVNNGTPDQCIEYANKCLELKPDMYDAQWNRALAYLEKGDWNKGWPGYAASLHDSATSSQKRKLRHYSKEQDVPYWDGTPGKRVVVYGEQGVGDEILAYSMLGELADQCDIILESHPRLVEISRHSFGEKFPIFGTRKVPWDQLTFPNWYEIDAKLPILGLGKFFRQKDEDFPRVPYLKPFEKFRASCRELLDNLHNGLPNIGVSWKGGSGITRFDLRSIPLESFLPALEKAFGRANWISLQYDPADRPGHNRPIIDSFNNAHLITDTLHHWPDVINDLDWCYGGMIHELDYVITVNTSLAHACGAYGVQCSVLTPARPAWRYNVPGHVSVPDNKMIWYGDHMTQHRQVEDEKWDAAVIDAALEAKKCLSQKRTDS